jgi:hypothetical protein
MVLKIREPVSWCKRSRQQFENAVSVTSPVDDPELAGQMTRKIAFAMEKGWEICALTGVSTADQY